MDIDADRWSKARRGVPVQHLPTGYVRDTEGAVALDSDTSVRDRIRLVVDRFLARAAFRRCCGIW
jgi:hypothetical protein